MAVWGSLQSGIIRLPPTPTLLERSHGPASASPLLAELLPPEPALLTGSMQPAPHPSTMLVPIKPKVNHLLLFSFIASLRHGFMVWVDGNDQKLTAGSCSQHKVQDV
jgi:hypothetical protein